MIFISAGHNPFGIKTDPGAVANGYREADLAIELRNLVAKELDALSSSYKTDKDEETLAQYLNRIQTGSGSVVIEFHFDAASSTSATGATSIVGSDADRLDKAFAKEIVDATAKVLGIRNRGVISESATHRGRLGLMRESGIVTLLEVGFITNIGDIAAFNCSKRALAVVLAPIIKKYEDLA